MTPCHTASSTAASPGPARPPPTSRTGRAVRPQGADCRFAEPHARRSCPLARASASWWACTLLAQTTNCGPTFRARARRGAPPRRAAAPEERNWPGGARGEPDSPRRSTPKCSTGKTFFVGNLAKRVNPVSDHVDHEVYRTVSLSLSEGLPPERTSPSARRGGRPPVVTSGQSSCAACSILSVLTQWGATP